LYKRFEIGDPVSCLDPKEFGEWVLGKFNARATKPSLEKIEVCVVEAGSRKTLLSLFHFELDG
jgi:hypothetical protein